MRLTLTAALFIATVASGQDTASWKRPYPAHTIAGNLHYVGTEELACFLVTTPQGHILINTGLAGSAPMIGESVRKLGFRLEDIRILLTMQAHFDHTGAMSTIQKISKAQVFATEADAPVLADGGRSDPFFGKEGWFQPVRVDRRLKDGEVIRLGGTELKVVATPGHSIGSVTYLMTFDDGGLKRSVAIANMNSVVMPLTGNPKYPNIAADYEQSFAKQKQLSPDIWVAAHASQYRMKEKHRAGSFVDPQGYKAAIAAYETAFRKQFAETRKK
jgi:metallo-beta-lactamase class B